MQGRLKNYVLVICLFVFLFVIVGGGLHLTPGGAFRAALSDTTLVVFAFNRQSSARIKAEPIPQRDSADKAVQRTLARASEEPLPEDYRTKPAESLPNKTMAIEWSRNG